MHPTINMQLICSMLNESDVGRSIEAIECVKCEMEFGEMLRGLSVHPITGEKKYFACLFNPYLDIAIVESTMENIIFYIVFDLEWAWRRPGRSWLEREVVGT